MIEDTPLLTIGCRFRRPAAEAVPALFDAPTGHVVDAMGGRSAAEGVPGVRAVEDRLGTVAPWTWGTSCQWAGGGVGTFIWKAAGKIWDQKAGRAIDP